MQIRTENTEDHQEVYELIKNAFASAEESDGTEQDLVVSLRKSKNFVPELSLVAVQNARIVGHILFTTIRIGEHMELALAPLAVSPQCQRQGIGLALMREGHNIAKSLGYHYSVVLGSEHYYPKAGYVPASRFGICPPLDLPDANYIALNLRGESTRRDGTVHYAKEFGI